MDKRDLILFAINKDARHLQHYIKFYSISVDGVRNFSNQVKIDSNVIDVDLEIELCETEYLPVSSEEEVSMKRYIK
jgi:hypothetical protein